MNQFEHLYKKDGEDHRDTVDCVWDLFNGPACHYGGFMERSSEVKKEANWQRKGCPALADVGGLWIHRIRLN